MSVNKVIIVGRLGQNPEVRVTPAGASVANFSVATNESWLDKSGQKQERTEWHRVVVWGKQAERCQQYLSKGKQVYIEGKLQTRQWQDQAGQTKYSTEVVAQTVQFLGASASSGASAQDFGGSYDSAPPPSSGGPGPSAVGGMPEPSFSEDDIPF